IRLRYAGSCASCKVTLERGTQAMWDSVARTATCTACGATVGADDAAAPARPAAEPAEAPEAPEAPVAPAPPVELDLGSAGRSAGREGQRRHDQREARIRTAHPRLGGLILALTDDPTSTTVWSTGAAGERAVGAFLDGLR